MRVLLLLFQKQSFVPSPSPCSLPSPCFPLAWSHGYLYQLILIMQTFFSFFTAQATLMRRSIVLNLPFQSVFPAIAYQPNSLRQMTIDQMSRQGILIERGRLSTIDLLNNVDRFVKKVNNIFNIKRS